MLEFIAQSLLSRGHCVEVLCFGEPMYDGCAEFDGRQPYKIHRVAAKGQRSIAIIAMAVQAVGLTATGNYDIVFCGVAWSSAIVARLTRLLTRLPYGIYTHGEDTAVVLGSRAKERILKDAFNSSSFLITNSNYSKTQVERVTTYPPCEVLFPTIDPTRYLTPSDKAITDLRNRYGLPESNLLLTVARLQSRKGHDTVIKCLPSLSQNFDNLVYVVVGKGEDQLALRRLADSLGVGDRLKIISDLTEDELVSIYQACSLYIMVSRWDPHSNEVEGFGMTYLEAAAAGKASVAGNQGGAMDAVVDGETGIIVDPESVEETSRAIETLLSNPELALQMGSSGRKRVLSEFNGSIFADRIEQLIVKATR